jgi:hypothetical protein
MFAFNNFSVIEGNAQIVGLISPELYVIMHASTLHWPLNSSISFSMLDNILLNLLALYFSSKLVEAKNPWKIISICISFNARKTRKYISRTESRTDKIPNGGPFVLFVILFSSYILLFFLYEG